MQPFFSIVIPVYNKENFIVQTLTSVFNQTFGDYEIVIVNDGSTDNSLEKIEAIEDSRITIHTTKNQGVSKARNFGIQNAQADYICFLDADDTWKPNHLATLKQLIDHYPTCGLYCTAYEKNHANHIEKSVYINIPETPWSGLVKHYFESSLINCIAWTSTVCIPKETFGSVGYFDPNITLGAGEDTDLWMRIALNHSVAFDNTVTGTHNLQAENRISNSNTNSRQFIDLDQYERFTDKHQGLKQYLDINRFSIALQYKLAGNKNKAQELIDKIDRHNLSFKQQLLLKLPKMVLNGLKNIQTSLTRTGLYLTPFK